MKNSKMRTEIKIISPELAKTLLEANTHNRAVSNVRVDSMARNMAAGEWKLTPETISFGTDGVLLNGQHRLKAVVKSGVSVPFLIAYDADPACFPVIDQGSPRDSAPSTSVPSERSSRSRRTSSTRASRPS